MAVALAWTAAAEPPDVGVLDEVVLVRSALDGPVIRSQIEASQARARAASTAPPWLANPTVEARHEQANGPAGAATQALGGTVTVDLGLAGLAERRAAGLRGDAGQAWVVADTLSAVCAVRGVALDLWLSDARLQRVATAHARLSTLFDQLEALARAGDIAGYDRDRLSLTVTRHRVDVEQRTRELAGARAWASEWTDRSVAGVRLAPYSAVGSLDSVLADAVTADPTLVALHKQLQAAEVGVMASRRAAVPDLTVSAGGRWDAMPDGSDRTPGFEVGAALEVPLFDRNQVAIRSARADVAQLHARVARREAEVRATVQTAWSRVRELTETGELVPTDTIWEAAKTRYSQGEASVDELLTVAAEVESAELAVLHSVEMRRQAQLDLSCATGTFPEVEMQQMIEEALR